MAKWTWIRSFNNDYSDTSKSTLQRQLLHFDEQWFVA